MARWTNRASAERAISHPPDVIRESVARAISGLGWKVTRAGDSAVEAVWVSPVFRFKDDVVIEIAPVPEGTLVRVHSASRVGRYDFGQNAKHIRDLFAAIESDSSPS